MKRLGGEVRRMIDAGVQELESQGLTSDNLVDNFRAGQLTQGHVMTRLRALTDQFPRSQVDRMVRQVMVWCREQSKLGVRSRAPVDK